MIGLFVGTPDFASAEPLPEGFVALHDIAPTIVEDMRYAGPRNFTGKALPGYGAARCILRKPVAEALAKVQAALAKDGLSLKVYDCYRPQRAVRAMHDWVQGAPAAPDSPHLPKVRRRDLIRKGYIAKRSSHASGTAVDLTIVRTGVSEPAPSPDRPCTAGPDDGSVDMGTGFDCFDPKSATESPEVIGEPKQWRRRLVQEMGRQGFRNYPREWWHFTLPGIDKAAQPLDFVIEAASPP
jgi:D-alanyl-D-alanine dipeptidase